MDPDQAINEAHAALNDDSLDDETALRRVVEALAAAHPNWSWVGVYLRVGDTLVLGPYVGPDTEHTRIPVGTGICGTAVETGRNMVVGDVKLYDNYLACSPGTQSELVLNLKDDGDIVGVIDIDSDDLEAFSPADLDSLRPLADVAGVRCRRMAATLT
jgi:L-methionine (R)-S-oxide reductase